MPHQPRGPRPPHLRPPEWIESEEKTRSLQDIGSRLVKIGELLLDKGSLKLGQTDVRPADPSRFMLRYERMPHGELSLKLEVLWDDAQGSSSRTPVDEDLEIG